MCTNWPVTCLIMSGNCGPKVTRIDRFHCTVDPQLSGTSYLELKMTVLILSTTVCSIRVFQRSSVYKCMDFSDLDYSLIQTPLKLSEVWGSTVLQISWSKKFSIPLNSISSIPYSQARIIFADFAVVKIICKRTYPQKYLGHHIVLYNFIAFTNPQKFGNIVQPWKYYPLKYLGYVVGKVSFMNSFIKV